MSTGLLSQIWLRVYSDPEFAARLRADFAGALTREGYLTALAIEDVPTVYGWHRDLLGGTAPDHIRPPTAEASSTGMGRANPHA